LALARSTNICRRFWMAGCMARGNCRNGGGIAPHQELASSAALRRAVAGQARLLLAQVLDVVGQLAVQETGRLVAGADQAGP
jgi:hypothetical protein